jgi:hypothetical protein
MEKIGSFGGQANWNDLDSVFKLFAFGAYCFLGNIVPVIGMVIRYFREIRAFLLIPYSISFLTAKASWAHAKD